MRITLDARRLVIGAMIVGVGTACQPADDPTPTLDTIESGAPLNPGGVEPSETQQEIDEDQ